MKRIVLIALTVGGVYRSILLVLLLLSCSATDNSSHETIVQVIHKQDFQIVDCLLPAQVRRLGHAQYMGTRRASKTTAHDCHIRGGEYVAYDRANYHSALNVWLPLATRGDAKAQNYVGEIYEKGLGVEPDFTQAFYWYGQSADQGFARAQINIGLLYERGMGVERDLIKALNYYRLASGIDNNAVLLSQDARAALEQEKNHFKSAIAAANQTILELEQQLSSATQNKQEIKSAQRHVTGLRALYNHSLDERSKLQNRLDAMNLAYRNIISNDFMTPENMSLGDPKIAHSINFGRYYALIIGNQEYQFLDDLRSPVKDAERLQEVLERRYGFTTQLIKNGEGKDILMAISRLFHTLGANDNLLIFYAGHGELSNVGLSKTERGYWLPVDAQGNNITHWLNNAVISDHLDRLKVRSVLVIADSCFAGYLGEDKSPYLFGLSSAKLSRAAIQTDIKRRARIVISSGGKRPVLDGNKADHSIFAGALIDVLENNDRPLRDSQLFSLLSVNVRQRADRLVLRQEPEMKPIREAGHEGGSFYFVPKAFIESAH
ncbi:caspase family protein [Marinagarivorans algicola]|uniref:caspase family protein n=1 Tax=Marinagarivorans algicola TaxID=1513270 RepID=UPI000B2F9F2B|nr:caspase family protein [Marinagarivorans algicola]